MNTRFRNILSVAALGAIAMFASCKKNEDTVQTSTPPLQIGQAVSDAQPLSGSIKGTMLTGKTYTINGDVTINAGDTLLLQKGVTVNITAAASITVKGTLISLGTQDQPNAFTVPGITKQDAPGTNPASDPAYSGKWYGINCDTTCKLLVLKWTHIEYTGATLSTIPVSGLSAGSASYAVFFQNPNGVFVMEDSWVYGTVDDGVRVSYGKVSIMRNTFEKMGLSSGDMTNLKSGSIGDIAYNLYIGGATNAIKASNSGATAVQANLNFYNNTVVDCGYRQATQTGHGGSINYEKQVKGKVYNNLVVNCKFGFRVVNTADTANMAYGNNYFYGDSLSVVNQFYPVGNVTHPQATDYPAPSTYLPANYALGAIYTASGVVSANNPMFRTFSLPMYDYIGRTYTSGSDFRLQASSPAIGKGTTAVAAIAAVPVDATFGATEITQPGADAGCYQSNGKGNKH